MSHTNTIIEIHSRLERIESLAAEIEAIPDWSLPGVFEMKKIDKKLQVIQDECRWIRQHMPGPYDTEPGTYDTEPRSDY